MKFLALSVLLAKTSLCEEYGHDHPFLSIKSQAKSGELARLIFNSHHHCTVNHLTVTFFLEGKQNSSIFPASLNTWTTVQKSVGVDYGLVKRIKESSYSTEKKIEEIHKLAIKNITYKLAQNDSSDSLYVWYAPPNIAKGTNMMETVMVDSYCNGKKHVMHGNFTITVSSSKALSASWAGLLLATLLVFQ
ncbi:hypothetical protein DSO57_1017120 [Entomophthora muscae]|uniref:Uncharacterized protein n=1 Tax=Entomophthora muscae TaxID=34485 RepID=A0ACC2UDI5_9FUNG|nr:hypothetical protein DSO57_1017120 [Entomophthora muscae]